LLTSDLPAAPEGEAQPEEPQAQLPPAAE